MFSLDLENFFKFLVFIMVIFFIIIGFKLTIVGQVILFIVCFVTLYFKVKDKTEFKSYIISILFFIIIGDLLYIIYTLVNFNYYINLINVYLSDLNLFR